MRKLLLASTLALSSLSFALSNDPTLTEIMSVEDQKATGVYSLSPKQKRLLVQWIIQNGCINTNNTNYPHENYTNQPVPAQPNASQQMLSAPKSPGMLNLNIMNGKYIQFVDGTSFQIKPEDTPISGGWITPASISVSSSNDPIYNWKLTNSLTQSSVNARQIPPSSLPVLPPTQMPTNPPTQY